jgi:hypothetical protein
MGNLVRLYNKTITAIFYFPYLVAAIVDNLSQIRLVDKRHGAEEIGKVFETVCGNQFLAIKQVAYAGLLLLATLYNGINACHILSSPLVNLSQ